MHYVNECTLIDISVCVCMCVLMLTGSELMVFQRMEVAEKGRWKEGGIELFPVWCLTFRDPCLQDVFLNCVNISKLHRHIAQMQNMI